MITYLKWSIFFWQTDYKDIPWGPRRPKKNFKEGCIKLGQNFYFSNRFQNLGNVTKDRPSWKPGGVYIRSEPRPGNIRYLFLLLLPLGKGQREKKKKKKWQTCDFFTPFRPSLKHCNMCQRQMLRIQHQTHTWHKIIALLPLLGNRLIPFGSGLDYVAVSNMRWLGPR